MTENIQPVSANPNRTDIPNIQPEASAPKNSTNYLMYAGLFIFIILILGMGGYILFTKSNKQNSMSALNNNQPYQNNVKNTPISNVPTIGVTPVTSANADQTLNSTNINMQNSINQANTDLNDLNNVDSTQDDPNNL